jgi:sigma54-dependent transcription regulator
MDTPDPYSAVTGNQSRFDAAADRRIHRAYRHLQRARQDGDFRRILKWKTRVDDLLDECMQSQQLSSNDILRHSDNHTSAQAGK